MDGRMTCDAFLGFSLVAFCALRRVFVEYLVGGDDYDGLMNAFHWS
jgi:hypothetical protein